MTTATANGLFTDADQTKLSCLLRVGGVNTIGDQKKLSCHVCSCVHTADETGSRGDKTVFSAV